MTESNLTREIPVRLQAGLLLVVLAWPTYRIVHPDWENYWVLRDGQAGTATVTGRLEHGLVEYSYKVNHQAYAGSDHLPKNQLADERRPLPFESTVHFSASHPWISRLEMPRSFLSSLPVLIILSPFVLAMLFAILRPPKVIRIGPPPENAGDRHTRQHERQTPRIVDIRLPGKRQRRPND